MNVSIKANNIGQINTGDEVHVVYPSAFGSAAATSCKIVLFSANPEGTSLLALDQEIREIREKISSARYAAAMALAPWPAARPDDLLLALEKEEPNVVQFSGHGTAEGQLLLNDKDDKQARLEMDGLVELIRAHLGKIRLVVLNACFSEPQALALAQAIECVVGMGAKIRNDAAIAFVAAFYRSIGFGHSVEQAFTRAGSALAAENLPGREIIRLFTRPGVNAAEVVLVGPPSS
jgi:hypothetical protein